MLRNIQRSAWVIVFHCYPSRDFRLKAQGSDLQSLASTLQALIRTHKEQNRRKMLQAFLPNVSDKSSENLNFTAIPKLQAKANFHLISWGLQAEAWLTDLAEG